MVVFPYFLANYLGKNMSFINTIKEAEEKADGIISDAKAEAKNIVLEANEKTSQVIENTEFLAKGKRLEALSNQKTELKTLYKKIFSEGVREAESIKEESAKNEKGAVKAILDRVMNIA